MSYISREAAIADVAMMAEYRHIPVDSYSGEVVGEVISILRRIPAADVRPVVRVKWIEDWETGYSECPACHDTFLWEDYKGVAEWNFCPNCGARMEES